MPRTRNILIAIGSALGLLAGGTAAGAAIAATPIDGSGVIHGCYTGKAEDGSHVIVLQDAGITCPRGTIPISWSKQGPAGQAGPQGPAGPAGATGPAGGNGTGATVTPVQSGDSNCPGGGAKITDGNGNTAYACDGDVTLSFQNDYSGVACTANDGSSGRITVDAANADIAACVPRFAPNTDCTHVTGADGLLASHLGGNARDYSRYSDCNDFPASPGDPSTYSHAMAEAAATVVLGWLQSNGYTTDAPIDVFCGTQQAVLLGFNDADNNPVQVLWVYTGGNAGTIGILDANAADCLGQSASWT